MPPMTVVIAGADAGQARRVDDLDVRVRIGGEAALQVPGDSAAVASRSPQG